MRLHKHFTIHKTHKPTATKHKSICADVFYKKVFLKNFPKSERKHLFRRLFKIKFQSYGMQLY